MYRFDIFNSFTVTVYSAIKNAYALVDGIIHISEKIIKLQCFVRERFKFQTKILCNWDESENSTGNYEGNGDILGNFDK